MLSITFVLSVLLLLLPIFYILIAFSVDKRLVKNISEDTLAEWHNDPENWRGGVIYHNPADPRILPPKRLKGLGRTINTGNRRSVAPLALLFLSMILIIVIMIITESA